MVVLISIASYEYCFVQILQLISFELPVLTVKCFQRKFLLIFVSKSTFLLSFFFLTIFMVVALSISSMGSQFKSLGRDEISSFSKVIAFAFSVSKMFLLSISISSVLK